MFSIADALDNYIESVTEERLPDGKYHPSSMFICTRQAIYGVRGVPTTNPPDNVSKRRFYIGHRLHESVQRALETMSGVKEVFIEFEVDDPDHNIVGHGDALVRLDDDTWVVVEIKSIKKWGLKKALPQDHHLKQAMVYAWSIRNNGVKVTGSTGEVTALPPLGSSLRGVLIVYVEKEDLKIEERFVEWNNEWNGEVLEKLMELNMYLGDTDSLPPRLDSKSWQCKYCAWKDKCWRVDPAEVEPKLAAEW